MNPTIGLNKQNDINAVKKWQQIIKVKDDGVFGPLTVAATKTWQKEHKLVADGIVGPATWAAALGKDVKIETKTPQASIDVEAYNIAKRAAPDMPEAQRRYTLSVARGEGFYGRGWNASKDPKVVEANAMFGLRGDEGLGSNNWGAEQGSGSAGSFPHVDYGWKNVNGQRVWKAYVGTYKRHKTPEEGYLSMAKIILGGGKRGAAGSAEIKSAIDKGDLKGAVFAQHANGYFELDPNKYLEAVKRNYNILAVNNDWKETVNIFGKILKVAGIAVLIVGAALGLKRII